MLINYLLHPSKGEIHGSMGQSHKTHMTNTQSEASCKIFLRNTAYLAALLK